MNLQISIRFWIKCAPNVMLPLLLGIAVCSYNPINAMHFACNEATAPTSYRLACTSFSEEDARAGIKLH